MAKAFKDMEITGPVIDVVYEVKLDYFPNVISKDSFRIKYPKPKYNKRKILYKNGKISLPKEKSFKMSFKENNTKPITEYFSTWCRMVRRST